MEKKTFGFNIKTLDNYMFEGYGSVFGNCDSYDDIVERGAFQRTINNNFNRIKVLWQHDTWEPIGKPLELVEDSKGLYIKAKLCMTDTGKKCYELMKENIINELSIGYETIKADYDTNNKRHLREVKLWEVSAVTFAANELATVNDVKSFDRILDKIKEGRVLSGLSQSKIQEAINCLMELIDNGNCEEALSNCVDSEKSTQLTITDSQKIDIDSELFNSILEKLKTL